MSEKSAHVEYTLTVKGQTVKFVGDVSYQEEMNSPYELSVFCVLEIPHGEGVAQVNRELRQTDVTLRMEREGAEDSAVEIHGVIANTQYKFSPAEIDEEMGSEKRRGFDLEIVPAYALLEHHKDQPRAWHNKSYAEVLEEVLTEGLGTYQRRVENKTQAGPKIPCITRCPGESLLKFSQRLLFEGGINLHFDHESGDGREILVLSDTNEGFQKAKLPSDDPISMIQSEGASFISKTKFISRSGSSNTTFGGFDPVQTPAINIKENTVVDGSLPSAASELRWTPVRHGGEELGAEGPHKVGAERHSERSLTKQHSVEIESSILSAQSGRSLPIDMGGRTVDHIVTGTSFSGGMGKFNATSRMTPVSTPDGQAITVRAPVENPPQEYTGVSLARVSSSKAAVDTDGQLWCLIKYVWDESGGDPPETRAPVLQPMAGTFGGTQWIPRKDDVVVVAFLEGSRENPVIIGCQYDKAQSPIHMGPASTPGHMKSEAKGGAGQQLPGSDTWLGWSHSSIAGDRPSSSARTMFAMNVAEGSELMYLNAPRDYRVDVTRNADLWVKGESTHKVAKDHVEDIGGKYEQTVKGKRTEIANGGYDLTVKGKSSLNLGAGGMMSSDGDMQIAANALIRCQSSSFRIDASSISFSTRPSVGGGAGGAATEHAGLTLKRRADLAGPEAAALQSGDSTVEAGARKILLDGPKIEMNEGGGATAKLEGGELIIDAPKGIKLRCGKSEIRITADGIEIDSDKVTVKSRGAATLEAESIKTESEQLKVDTKKAIVNAERLDITGEGEGLN